ncbi:hypothetical protein ACEPPN_007147 [Leptodophora sp. 'Broadleaf-Isolate-01']
MAKTRGDFDIEPGSLFDNMQVRLFDSMSRLSGLAVSGDIKPPQLVVVGAQNSGKSSVLEALVRFHFPVDSEKPTTRFPIKLVLRKADKETTKVSIEAEESRSEEWKRRLNHFTESLSVDNNFDHIMERAKAEFGVHPSDKPSESPGNPKKFCEDVLVIERHGPRMPELSLVDLPGLFDAASTRQTRDDRGRINSLVSKYIESPRNIILLVVSAEVNDYSNVPALGLIQDIQVVDTTLKRRAICVITRPDMAGSLATTQGVLGKESLFSGDFSRPWHVVRNQDEMAREQHQSLEERDQIEKEFFDKLDWEAVPPEQKGIAALRETLKSMIWSHTKDQLPDIISEIKAKIKQAEAQLDSTMRARATPKARREYLGNVAERFSILTREAVKGTYENEGCGKDHQTGEACQDCEGFFDGFGNNSVENQQKRLRGNIRALNRAFAAAMRQYGKTKIEIEAEGATTPPSHTQDPMSKQHGDGEPCFQPHGTKTYYIHDEPERQGRKEYEQWVRENMDYWKAKGPGGEPSDGTFLGLFAYQARKWGKIASQHVRAVWRVVEEFIKLAVAASCADRDVLAALQYRLVTPNLESLKLEADRTLRDLVSCHVQSNPGFYDGFVEAYTVREHTKALLQRLAAMRPELVDSTEASGASATSSTEQTRTNAQQGSVEQPNAQRHQDPKPKGSGNSQRSGDKLDKDKAKDDHNQKSREEILTYALENVTAVLSSGYPFLNNSLVQKKVIPMIASQISTILEFNNDSGGKEKRTEIRIRKTVQDLYPSNFGDLAAARVIEQVEMHYEAIRASFIGYVASLVVEQKIMARLSQKVLTMTLIRDIDDNVIDDIAGETLEDAKKRKDIERDLNTMREVLQTMEEYLKASHDITR